MSRSRRTVDSEVTPDEVWDLVDRWADTEVDPIALRARWSAKPTPVRGLDEFIDVADKEAARDALRSAGESVRPVRPERRALGRTGELALVSDDDVIAVLEAADVDHRVVTRARRYLWRGPMTGPTYCEISSTSSDGPTVVEAWHEPAWTDSLRPRMAGGDDDERRRPPRRVLQARASINRLLAALGVDPIHTS